MATMDSGPEPIKETPAPRPPVTDEVPKNKGGRPPGTGTGTRMSPDVKQALGVMQTMYDGLGMLVNATAADELIVGQYLSKVDGLQARNQAFFEADPKLAKRIAKWGSDGGTAAFIIANVSVLWPFVFPAAMTGFTLIRTLFAMWRGGGQQEDTYTPPTAASNEPPEFDFSAALR